MREGAIDDGAAVAVKNDPLALGRRVQAVAGLHDAGVDQFLVEFPHCLHQLSRGHDAIFAALGGFYKNDNTHDLSSLIAFSVVSLPGTTAR
ncbi:hypothetical protein D3C86_1988300 [compost metagenome]